MNTEVNIKSAAPALYNHKASPYTIASLDFSELVPTRKFDMVPRHQITNFVGNGFLRLAPQVFPAYGKCTFNSAAFFVSESQIIEGAKAFHQGKLTNEGKPVRIPYILASEINAMFMSHSDSSDLDDPYHLCKLVALTDDPAYGQVFQGSPSATPSYRYIKRSEFDFMYPIDYNESFHCLYGFYKLTRTGCKYYKILKGCGFDWASFPAVITTSYTVQQLEQYANYKVSLMAFLAYMKIYVDYFLNPQTFNYSQLVFWLRHIHDAESITPSEPELYNSLTGKCSFDLVWQMLKEIRVPHHKNMYLNSYNSPNSPLGVDGVQPSFPNDSLLSPIIPSPVSSSHTKSVIADSNDVSFREFDGADISPINSLSPLGLNFLASAYDFCRRNNLLGSKSVEEFFGRYGIKPNDYNSNFASKLFEGQQEIDFSAVMSNSDTFYEPDDSGKSLGSYAGFGIGSLNFDFNYQSSEYGFIFVLSWLQQVPILLHGFLPSALRINYLDSWTPEFDGKGIRSIPMCEISTAPFSDLSPDANGDKKVFGFSDIYDDYREERDMVLGDFVTSEAARNFLFCRDLSEHRCFKTAKMTPQSNALQYIASPLYDNDMSDPFQMGYKNGDRFYLQFKFEISHKSPVKSKSVALDLNGVGDMKVQINGRQMS